MPEGGVEDDGGGIRMMTVMLDGDGSDALGARSQAC